MEELAIEIPNHAEMYTFVVLKKDINLFDKTTSNKYNLLKAIDQGMINFRNNDNVNQCMYFLRTVATDASIVFENCEEYTESSCRQVSMRKLNST